MAETEQMEASFGTSTGSYHVGVECEERRPDVSGPGGGRGGVSVRRPHPPGHLSAPPGGPLTPNAHTPLFGVWFCFVRLVSVSRRALAR
eukprot:992844-Rhodomonas_salina.3